MGKTLTRTVLSIAMLVASTGFLFAAGSTETASDEPTTLNITLSQDPYIIDPTANWLYEVPANMFVPLLEYDYAAGKPVPGGAESWTVSADGKTYTFKIRKNWTWSDGTPVTAGDYVYAFQRIVDPALAAPMAYRVYIIENAQAINTGEIADLNQLGVKALDDSTLQITLNQPATWFLSSLSSIGHAIPKWAVEKYGDDWTLPENIVVDGPYILTKLVTDDYAVLEKNPTYFDADKVSIDKINMYIVKEESTALAMYENGEIDYVTVPGTDLDRVKSDATLSAQYYNGPRFVLYYYIFNVLKPPFDNVKVRQSFAAAIDKQTIVTNITRGGEVAAPTLTPPGSVGSVPASAGIGIPYDPARAKSLLAEAGFAGGKGLPAITLAFNAGETNSRIAQAVQKMWQDTLGATINLQPIEGRAYSQMAGEGAFNVWRMGWGMDYPDANNIQAEIFHSNVGSPAVIKNAEFDKVVDEAAVIADPDERLKLYEQAEKILVQDEAGAIPIYWYAENLLIKPYLHVEKVPTMIKQYWTWTMDK